MKTYSRDDWFKAKDAWATFVGPRWDEARRAASGWTIWPPSSQGQDWRDAPHPSQRIIVWFGLENRPAETLNLIRRAHSWSGVVDRLIASDSERRRNVAWDEEEAELEHRYQRQQYRTDTKALAEILKTIADSAA